jgi:hypothetical protein
MLFVDEACSHVFRKKQQQLCHWRPHAFGCNKHLFLGLSERARLVVPRAKWFPGVPLSVLIPESYSSLLKRHKDCWFAL